MTRAQLRLAAELWAASLVANTELTGDSPDANKVRQMAVTEARFKLERFGVTPGDIRTEQDAITAATRLLGDSPPAPSVSRTPP